MSDTTAPIIPGAVGTIVIGGKIVEADPVANAEWVRIDEEAADYSRREYQQRLEDLLRPERARPSSPIKPSP